MTVKELIENLKQFDETLNVEFNFRNEDNIYIQGINDLSKIGGDEYPILEFDMDYNPPVISYKCITVDRSDWENAPSPICTDKISDKDLEEMAKELYEIMTIHYGIDEKDLENSLSSECEDDNDEYIHDLYWKEYEELIIEYGGVYYEDLPIDE